MSDGLLYVAFGDKFDRMAAHTIEYSRRFTDMPITVLTNIQNRCTFWQNVNDINFVFINDVQKNNRQYKTTMINYSPYDRTIYLDADSIVQQKGIERAFNKLNGSDIMLNIYGRWNDKIPLSYYKIALAHIVVSIPIVIYYGAFIGFGKSESAKNFFKHWNENWIKSTIAREMPALAGTVKKSEGLKLIQTNNNDNIFTWKKNREAIIQHEYGSQFWNQYFPKGLN